MVKRAKAMKYWKASVLYGRGWYTEYFDTKADAKAWIAEMERVHPVMNVTLKQKTLRLGENYPPIYSNPSDGGTPITARKTASGVIVSVKVPTLQAAASVAKKLGARVMNPSGYRIESTKGPDYYNDPDVYSTKAQAMKALASVRKWAKEQAKYEPSYKGAKFKIVSA